MPQVHQTVPTAINAEKNPPYKMNSHPKKSPPNALPTPIAQMVGKPIFTSSSLCAMAVPMPTELAVTNVARSPINRGLPNYSGTSRHCLRSRFCAPATNTTDYIYHQTQQQLPTLKFCKAVPVFN